MTAIADHAFRNDGPQLGLVFVQIGANRTRPIDIADARARAAAGAIDRAADRLRGLLRQSPHQLIDHFAHHLPRRVLRLCRHGGAQADQIGDQMHVGFERRQEFRLHQHRLEPQPLERIALDHLHDRSRKELADVAEPARHPRGRGAETASPLRAARVLATAIKRGQGPVHADVPLGEAIVVLAAERKTPAAAPLVIRKRHRH